MSLKTLFQNLNKLFLLEKNPHTNVKRLLESYKGDDWLDKIKHQIMWFNNPHLYQGHYIKTPIFYNNSNYFDMFVIGYPPSHTTNIENLKNNECYFKVLQGAIIEKKYKLTNSSSKNQLTSQNVMYYNSPIANIGYLKNNEYHSINNNLKVPSYTLNIYSKK